MVSKTPSDLRRGLDVQTQVSARLLIAVHERSMRSGVGRWQRSFQINVPDSILRTIMKGLETENGKYYNDDHTLKLRLKSTYIADSDVLDDSWPFQDTYFLAIGLKETVQVLTVVSPNLSMDRGIQPEIVLHRPFKVFQPEYDHFISKKFRSFDFSWTQSNKLHIFAVDSANTTQDKGYVDKGLRTAMPIFEKPEGHRRDDWEQYMMRVGLNPIETNPFKQKIMKYVLSIPANNCTLAILMTFRGRS